MAAGALALLVVLVAGIGFGLVLFWLVRAESRDREVMDRIEAERMARSDDPNGDEGTQRG